MKKIKYFYAVLLFMLSLGFQSCFQDLDQDPPFDYPEQPTPPPLGADGQIFYLSFDKELEEYQSLMEAIPVGSPGFADGKTGKAYAGAANSYLTFNLSNLAAPLGNEVTFGFWYKLNGNPNRAGIIVIGPPTEGAAANMQNNRTSGIRIFRENDGDFQRIKANIGDGNADTWLDGGATTNLNPATADWVYIALVLRSLGATLYLNGEAIASSATFSGISWKGCDVMSIGSGAPRFTEWNHNSDNSLIDELRIYNKALTEEQIRANMTK
ncbi:LamG domain-containing protein [Proteiniphilum sp.]|uniref:LamG domain-containing protein n=1 Tax=Proteiniphilum sp. TaxID=1926877 RepID=UPI002B216FBE|nr:LamG domain-containing protein [Proteiniphilum sp.]MEA4919038.1 LamG domain-containing protein [Proteiniphilum sp.]